MRRILLTLFIIAFMVSSVYAFDGFSVGPYYGYGVPVANEWAKPGPTFGVQAKASLMPWIGAGLYYNSRAYGDVDLVYFEGETFEFTETLEGGDVSAYGLNFYLGQIGNNGLNYFLVGGIGSHKWDRETVDAEPKISYSAGLGLEYVIPANVGVEARGVFDLTADNGRSTWKSVMAYVGLNYHFKFGPM